MTNISPEQFGAVKVADDSTAAPPPPLPVQRGPNPADFGATPAAPQQRTAHGAWDDLVAGFQGSATGLMLRGKLPDVVLDPSDAKWYDKALSGAAGTVSDLPEMAAGFSLGGAAGGLLGGAAGSVVPGLGTVGGAAAGTVLGAGAGAFAVPTAIRESLIQAYQNGTVTSSADFLSRAAIVLKETGKSALVGAATAGAGTLAARSVGAAIAPAIGESIGVTGATRAISAAQSAAEVGAMTVAPAALEGRLPEPADFANAAILVGGMHAAGSIAQKMGQIYAQAGVTPEQVLADTKADPGLAKELTTPPTPETEAQVPAAYANQAAADNAKLAMPEPGTVPTERTQMFVNKPFGEIPQEAGTPKVDLHVNYDYVNNEGDVKAVLARASELYADKIESQTRGTVGWQQTEQEGANRLAEMVGAKDSSLLADRQPGTGSGTTEMYLRGQLMLGAVEDFTRKSQAYDPQTSSPQEGLELQAAAERVAMLSANFQGAASEAGRALNVLKMVNQGLRQADAIKQLMEGYTDPADIARVMNGVDNPVAAAAVARKVIQPEALSTNQKFMQVRNFSLLLGFKVPQVKLIGDSIAWASGVVDRVVAAGVGLVTPGEEKVTPAEIQGFVSGSFAGTRRALQMGVDAWQSAGFARSEANVMGYRPVFGEGAKAGEPSEPPEPGSGADIANKVLAIPHRVIGAETEFARGFNEGGEARALAIRQAIGEGLTPGTNELNSRVYDIEKAATDELDQYHSQGGVGKLSDIAESVRDAADKATFTNKLGKYGQAMQKFAQTPIGGYIVPFTTVPANLVAWAVRRLPGAAFALDDVKADFEAGGATRDMAIARQVVGATILTAAYGAVKGGLITGGGLAMTPDQRRAAVDAGWQPYSFKVGNNYYGYNRFEPIARIASLAADFGEVFAGAEKKEAGSLESEDRTYLPLMLGAMFGNAVVSQTYLSGLNEFMQMLTDPARMAPRVWDSFVGSWVPAVLAQTAAATDPTTRRIDSAFDAVKNRLPGIRETLLPNINGLTGEPMQNKSNLTPVDVTDVSQDKVLSEAARLGVGVAKTPKSLELSSMGERELGKVDLTPEQQTLFSTTSGKLAHSILENMVSQPDWDERPDVVKTRIFAKVLEAARKSGAAVALPAEERIAKANEIAAKINEQLDQFKQLHQ